MCVCDCVCVCAVTVGWWLCGGARGSSRRSNKLDNKEVR